MKILFITANGIEDLPFGGAKVSVRNYKALQNIGSVCVYTIGKKSNFGSMVSILQGYYPPICKRDYKNLKKILKEGFDWIFCDGSIYGRLIDIKQRAKIIVFYHNCEQDFIKVRFGNKISVKQKIYKRLVIKSESYLSQKADYRIVLSLRDKKRVEELYGVKVDRIIPLGIEDKFEKVESATGDSKCLLLGALCEANLEGYQWFVENVSPFLSCKTEIAGKGFEAYREKWESKNVSVLGYVENLNDIYSDASCVAIPLFSGAGMKVKTVEALMFGKTIFGTDEAYSGFEKNCGYLCNNAEEFIEKINNYISQGESKCNEKARKIYEDFYSVESGKKNFEKVFNDLKDQNK